MYTTLSRSVIPGLAVLICGIAALQASGQGSNFTVGQGMNLAGGLGGGSYVAPGAGAGFNPLVSPDKNLNPFQSFLTNPYGGAGASMTSQLYQPPPPNNQYGGYGNYIYPDPYGGYL